MVVLDVVSWMVVCGTPLIIVVVLLVVVVVGVGVVIVVKGFELVGFVDVACCILTIDVLVDIVLGCLGCCEVTEASAGIPLIAPVCCA